MMEIKENIKLAQYATLKIGGPARFFVEVSNEDEMIETLAYAKENNLNFFILGGGSNVLFSDEGFDGLVIKLLGSKSPRGLIEPGKIECWAGDSMGSVVKLSAENSLTGLEWAGGLPGTVGGAVRGNAGAFGFSMADNIEKVKIIDMMDAKAELKIFTNEDCGFSYRSSIFKRDSNLIILSCVLKLQEGDKSEIRDKIKENIEKRTKNQPKELSSGSFFKNPVVENEKLIEEFEHETGSKCEDKKIPAGWLIMNAGLGGKKIGGAMISEKHNNFIINTGLAKAEDIIILSSLIKQQVRDKFGLELKEEVQLVGF